MAKVARFDSETTEKLVVGYELSAPKYYRHLEPLLFAYAMPRKVQECMNAFYTKYGSYPSVESIKQFTQDPDILFFVANIGSMPCTDDGVFKQAIEELAEMAATRAVFDEAKGLVEGLKGGKTGRELAREVVKRFSNLPSQKDMGEIRRGFAHDKDYLQRKWEEYKSRRDHPERFRDFIPYGIAHLDRLVTGGTRPGHLTLIYSETSGGKTRFKANLAYNMAMLGKRVMYISIEDPFDEVARMWYSRASLLDYTAIEMGKLNAQNTETYRKTLELISKQKNLPYLVFWPGDGTIEDIKREVRGYEAVTGQLPEVLFIDYSNEMYPDSDYENQSERFNFLFSGYRRYAADNRIALITSMQQSRTGQQKKKEEDYGLEDIGQSHYVATHCHVVLFLKQTQEDRDSNLLKVYVKKNRYGKKDETVNVNCFWNLSFVGDRERLQPHEYVKQLLETPPDDVANEAYYENAPVNDPHSSSVEEGEALPEIEESEETVPEN